jgi:polyisoprenoid-binding protein YceI
VGIVRINARTLETDSNLRDRAIRNRILNSNEFEFISFTPTEITNLPTGGEFGDSFEIQITGDLTIRNITAQETFDVTVTPISETRIEGSGQATVSRSTYNLTIPSVRDVAEVDEEVVLEIEFVAVR